MIKSIWTIITTVALANLLAIIGVVVWLKASDRLNGDRVEEIRTLFSETVAERQARLEAEAEKAAAEEAARVEEEKKRMPPISAQDTLALQSQHDAIMQQNLERTRRTLEDMRRTLEDERAQLDGRVAAFEAEVKAFNDMRQRIMELEGDEQFKKALTLYESLSPKDAASTLRQLYDFGQREQVVAYLNAMESRKASKIVAEFDPPVAADLLERLRTRGLVAAKPEE